MDIPFTASGLPKLAFTISEAVEASGIGRNSLYQEIAAGRLPARKRGRTTLILVADLESYLAALPDA